MNDTLLQTKLTIPPLRPNLVSRPRLIERLNRGLALGCKLTLISAGAGFGKTTLITEWGMRNAESEAQAKAMRQLGRLGAAQVDATRQLGRLGALRNPQICWVSLDEGDDDPIRFLSYLVAAIQTIEPGLGKGVAAALQSPQPPATEALLTTLINQIGATANDRAAEVGPSQSSPPGHTIVLVLDDYHLITAQANHDALTFLLDHLPDNMHLMIATRSDPPLPLARLRGRGLLAEVRETDLRFSVAEAAQFINKAMGLKVSADDLSALTARTEGWIAGLQMAAVSMQSRGLTGDGDDVTGQFITEFTGSNRFILDYLVEEVLQSQPESVRAFLLHTAILDRLTAPLCDAVLGQANAPVPGNDKLSVTTSQDTLEHLERANLFVVPLDDERRWYRYHHLFADLLRNQLNKTHPGLDLTLHRRASQWFEQVGLIPEAMHHAVEVGEFDRAADLLASIVSSLLNESRPATLLSLMARLPDETIAARPLLAVHGAWAYFMTWQFDAIEPLLQSVELKLSAGPAGQQPEEIEDANRIRVRLIGLRAFMAQWQGDLAAAIALSHQALKEMDEGDLQLRSVLESNLADICLIRGDLASAKRHAGNSLAAGKSAKNFYSALSAICRLAEVDVIEGRLHQAAKTFQQGIQQGIEWGGEQPMPGTGRAHVGLAQVLYEWNDLAGAERHLRRGLRLGEECGAQEIVLPGYLMQARLRQAQGEARAATLALERAEEIAPTEMSILPAGHVSSWQTRISLAQGDIAAAIRWANTHEISLDGPEILDHRLEEFYLTLARVRIAQGQVEEAERLLDGLLPAAEAEGRVGRAIEIQLLRALALQARGEVDQAMIPLQQILTLAEPQAYTRIFLDEGSSMAHLLYEAAARGIAPHYAGKLLASFGQEDSLQPLTFSPDPLIEPLSDRELQVLQLIAEGLSNQEIASRLVLSLNTVKGHTRKIHGKLGVHRRTEAVARARDLGLL